MSPDVLIAAARLDPGPDEEARLGSLLDADESARAARYVFERDRRRFRVARGRLREWLSGHIGVAPGQLAFTYGPRGKPSVAGGPHFSLSHSGERVLMAISLRAPVGIDVEMRRTIDDPLALARRVFAPEEVADLLAAEDRLAAFFATWTRKEAVIKATGLGVSQPLDAFSTRGCVLRGDPAVGRPEAWSLADVEVEDGYPAAVALIAPGARMGAVTWL